MLFTFSEDFQKRNTKKFLFHPVEGLNHCSAAFSPEKNALRGLLLAKFFHPSFMIP
jgi:hypothetical protein